MNSRLAKTLLTITATALVALPGVAQARQGADDPAGHVRHNANATEVHHHHHNGAGGRHGADDAPGHD